MQKSFGKGNCVTLIFSSRAVLGDVRLRMLPLEMSLLDMSVTRNDNAFCCECESRFRERDRRRQPLVLA